MGAVVSALLVTTSMSIERGVTASSFLIHA